MIGSATLKTRNAGAAQLDNHFYILGLLLVAAGVAFGHMTSLRFTSKIGFSELAVLLGLLILIPYVLKNNGLLKYGSSERFLIYWFIWCVTILPLVTIAFYIFSDTVSDFLSIAIYSGQIFFSIILVKVFSKADVRNFFVKKCIQIFVLSLFISAVLYGIEVDVGRYSGASKNPNQLAIYLAGMLCISTFYLDKSFLLKSVLWVLCAYAAYQTKSDAFVAGIFLGLVGIFLVLFIKMMLNKKSHLAFVSFGLLFIALFIFALVSGRIYSYFDYFLEIWSYGDQGSQRLTLWLNGIEAFLTSPIVGLGGGSFSTGDGSVSFGQYGISEAHNTVIDLAMTFGAIPVFWYLWYYVKTIRIASINGHYLIIFCIFLFFGISMFHHVARHFVFWVIISLMTSYISSQIKVGKGK